MAEKKLIWALPAVVLSLCFSPFSASTAAPLQPYAGQENRQIKSLSAEDVDDLLAGRGWGLAKPAELNGYPGPAHVLEAADDLQLSPEAKAKIEAIFSAMNAEAKRLGKVYVDAERRLEEAFSKRNVARDDLEALIAEAETARASLRLVHLNAHLETAPLLTRHQTMQYNRLRGYDAGSENTHKHHGGNH